MFKLKNKISVCKQAGESHTNPQCTKLKKCSWFRHSQEGLKGGAYPTDAHSRFLK